MRVILGGQLCATILATKAMVLGSPKPKRVSALAADSPCQCRAGITRPPTEGLFRAQGGMNNPAVMATSGSPAGRGALSLSAGFQDDMLLKTSIAFPPSSKELVTSF